MTRGTRVGQIAGVYDVCGGKSILILVIKIMIYSMCNVDVRRRRCNVYRPDGFAHTTFTEVLVHAQHRQNGLATDWLNHNTLTHLVSPHSLARRSTFSVRFRRDMGSRS